MPGSLGTIRGQIRLDVASAIAGYAAVRAANASTINTMNDARNRMRGFGLAAVGMGAAFLTGFGMAVNAAADFEKKLDYFGAVNNATAAEMEKVRAKALELGRTSVYSASQIADALVEMGKAGVSAKDITDGMADAMVNMAQAADIDLAQATNIVTSQIQAYELSAKDATHVTDLMAGAANASIIDITDIGVSMKYVAGVAHSLGISIDSTTDAISLLGKAGIKGSTAGTSLRQIMVSLAGGTNKAKEELEELGIITADGENKFFTAEGKAKSLGEVFQILQDHTANLSDKERIMAMRTIFNNRALAAAAILTKQGSAGFKEMNAEISKTTAADVAAKRMDNLSGDIRRLKGTFETFLIEGGTPFQEFLRSIVRGITQVVAWFAALPRGLQTSIFAFMAIAGVVLVLAGGIALMGAALSGAIGALGSVAGAFKMLGPILWTATKATWALTVAALANPYVWIAIAVIALVAALILLYKRSDKVREIMDAIGRGIKAAWEATIEWFKGLPKFFSDLWSDISGAFTAGVDWVVDKWNSMVDWFAKAPGRIGAYIAKLGSDMMGFVSSVPGRVTGALSTAWTSFIDFMDKLPERAGYAIGFVIGRLVRFGVDSSVAAYRAGEMIVLGVLDWFAKLPGRVASFLTRTYESFQAWVIEFTLSSIKFGSDVYNSVSNWFAKLPARIATLLNNMATSAKQKWDQTLTWSKDFAVGVYNSVVHWFSQLPTRVANFATDMANKAKQKWDQAVYWASTTGADIYNSIVYFVQMLPGKVWDILGNVVGAFKNMVVSAYNNAKDFAGGLWDGFKDGLGIHSPSFIEEAMRAITRVTGAESEKLKRQVRGMQGLGKSLQSIHDTASNVVVSPAWYQAQAEAEAARRREMREQERQELLERQGRIKSGSAKSAAQKAAELAGSQRAITVNVYNPTAERASDTTARKLRTLGALGAFS